jgi:hypothetical protein
MKKFFNVGFEAIEVVERRPFGLEDLFLYPLFPPDFVAFLRKAIPADRHHEVVRAITVTARRPAPD